MDSRTGIKLHYRSSKFFVESLIDLSLYVRQIAWYKAIVKNKSVAGLNPGSASHAEESRLESFRKLHGEDYKMELPPLESFSFLIELLFEVGPFLSTGMGFIPLTFSELESWQNLTNTELSSWEVTAIQKLSTAYVTEYSEASDKEQPKPYTLKLTYEEQTAVSNKLRNVFANFKKRK